MIENSLHELDIQLCIYALNNIRGNPRLAEYAKYVKYVEKVLAPPTLAYLVALDVDGDKQPLLLTSEELYVLASDIEGGPLEFNKPWEADDRVHRMSIDCTREIREAFSLTDADAWASASAEFASELERGKFLSTGLYVILAWVDQLRRHLRALGATAFLPHPEGSFPTPACPEPAATLPPANLAAQNGSQRDIALAAPIAEIQSLQRELRDLLLSQKTIKEHYTTEELAEMLGKAEFTVREWCRHGRIHAEKKGSGRGRYQAWVVSHEELLRIQKEGLLPFKNS